MVLTVTQIRDNPYQPLSSAETYLPDQLIAGAPMPHSVTALIGGGAVLTRGTIMGKMTTAANPTTGVAAPSNVGNGTLTAVTGNPTVHPGIYVVRLTSPTTFNVIDPMGVVVGSGTVGTPYTSTDLNLTVTAATTLFVAGDSFNVIFPGPTSGKWLKSLKAAADGTQNPVGVLADTVDATASDQLGGIYIDGVFNARALILDASWTNGVKDIIDIMHPPGFVFKWPVSAVDPV
jgi:hypothetical protein